MKEINLEAQFLFYLEKMGLNPAELSAIQLQETKRAFFGGMSQMWVLFLEIGELPEGYCDVIFADLEKQIDNYWINEIEVHQ